MLCDDPQLAGNRPVMMLSQLTDLPAALSYIGELQAAMRHSEDTAEALQAELAAVREATSTEECRLNAEIVRLKAELKAARKTHEDAFLSASIKTEIKAQVQQTDHFKNSADAGPQLLMEWDDMFDASMEDAAFQASQIAPDEVAPRKSNPFASLSVKPSPGDRDSKPSKPGIKNSSPSAAGHGWRGRMHSGEESRAKVFCDGPTDVVASKTASATTGTSIGASPDSAIYDSRTVREPLRGSAGGKEKSTTTKEIVNNTERA